SRHRRALCGVAPSIWWRGSSACPWCKGVLDVPERGRQGGKVAQLNGGHAIRVDPVEPFWCVDRGCVIGREEAVALQAARRHEQEDPQSRVAEPQTRRQRLSKQAHHE